MQKEEAKKEIVSPPKIITYLPGEGLQGEDIPSHALWENAKVKSIQVSFHSPLKLKEVFNAESWLVKDNTIFVEKVECDGYLGLSFGSSKVAELEVIAPVEYSINLVDMGTLKEVRKIKLFRPQLGLDVQKNTIAIMPKTRFIKDRIKIRNVGRGSLMIYISTDKGSPAQLEVPRENRESAEKLLSDLQEELSKVATDFPQFKPYYESVFKWEAKEAFTISEEERTDAIQLSNGLTHLLASNENLLKAFMSAYGRALAKNSELLEIVRRIVSLYESLLSKDILLVNPFDEIPVKGKANVALKISQTDKVFDEYKDIPLPMIELTSSEKEEVRIPVYRLFEWR
jgi:hypothetical protein